MTAVESTQTASWHAVDAAIVVTRLGSQAASGLAPEEAAERRARDGPNALPSGEEASPAALFAGQFRSVVIWVLLAAAAVAGAAGEVVDATAIVAIVVLNAVIGFVQEYRAERAGAALARLGAPRARVVRGGTGAIVAAADVVRGDVIVLEAGDVVPADARLLTAAALRTTEAALTGESEPVAKHAEPCLPEAPLAERRSMVFLGTSIAQGTARAVVVATGRSTEFGHIAALLETAARGKTPLQSKLDQVGRRLLAAASAIVAAVFALGLLRGGDPFEMFLAAVGLAVAAVPEGLPAVVTVTLALGVQRMARRHVLIRRLPAVETLGCAQVICTDKTGTLTVGEMTARKLVTSNRLYEVTGEGYTPDGRILVNGTAVAPADDAVLDELLQMAAGCNDAEITTHHGNAGIVGDPTEGALLVVAAKAGLARESIERDAPRLGDVPFDSERKRMTVVRRRTGRPWAYVKGAPEVVLERCTTIMTPEGAVPLSEAWRARMADACALLAREALRVLALAARPLDAYPADAAEIERGLTLIGLVGLQDPPRRETRAAVTSCKRAGIKVVMITGDHPDTAAAIGRELGIVEAGDRVMVGRELDRISDERLAKQVPETAAYARVTAEHKLRIVRAWKAHGSVVAMTGDGVNDAPALKEASIGIAMGRTGTEVTKQSADMIVTDDDFSSIVAAVEEGRGIYDNIAKTLAFLLAGNVGELMVVSLATLAGWPLPLLPIQLLWINLVTDGLPALALATDPVDPTALARPPRRPDAEIVDRAFLARLAFIGCLTALTTLTAFAYELFVHGDLRDARNAAFSVLVFAELLRAFGARSDVRPVWQMGFFSNARLLLIVVASFTLQIAIHHEPSLARLFGTAPISLGQCVAWIGLGALPLLVLELRKAWRSRFADRPKAATHSSEQK